MDKKAELLREKILTNAHISHNNTQYRLQELNDQHDINTQMLNQSISQFAMDADQAIQDYQTSVEELSKFQYKTNNQSQQSSNSNSNESKFNILSVKEVKNYLNAEKNTLKQIVEKAESGVSASSEDKIHQMMRKNYFNSLLEKMRKKQLSDEIKYLSEHVVTDSGVIYVPDSHMTQAQQLQLNQKITALIEEVERVNNLQTICQEAGGGEIDSCEVALKALKLQALRLQKIDKMLTNERSEVSMFQKWISSFDNFTKDMPYPNYKNSLPIKFEQNNISIDLEELQAIQGLKSLEGNIVDCRNCDHEEISSSLRKLMIRVNKIK